MPSPWTDPAPLADIEGGETNLLPRLAWSDPAKPLKVEFDLWEPSNPSPDDPESIEVFLGDRSVGFKQWTAPIDAGDHFVSVSSADLIPGEHVLTYEMTNWLGTPEQSLPFTVTVDKEAPIVIPGSELIFPTAVLPPNKLTARYLEQNGDQVKADIPTYATARPGDRIKWFWGTSPADFNEGGVIDLDAQNHDKPLVLVVEKQLILARGNGDRYVTYQVHDRAGNQSAYSTPVKLDVDATPIPRILPPSKVKEANGGASSGVLVPNQGINGVTVTIPATAVIYDDEEVFVQWAAQGTVGSYRTNEPVTAGSKEYKIPKDKIAAHSGRSLTVNYEVLEPGILRPHVSQTYRLNVEDLKGLPTVQCDKVTDKELSLASLTTGFANFTLSSWTFMATDQFLTVVVKGVGLNNQQLAFVVLDEVAVPEEASVISAGLISKTDLESFKLNSIFHVTVKVSFDGKQTWKDFPTLMPMLVA